MAVCTSALNKTASVTVLLGVSVEATAVLPPLLVRVPLVIFVSQGSPSTKPDRLLIEVEENVPPSVALSPPISKAMVKLVLSLTPESTVNDSLEPSELLTNVPDPPVILPLSSPTNVSDKLPVKLPGVGHVFGGDTESKSVKEKVPE